MPSILANSVKSRPMPTFLPGMDARADLAHEDVAGLGELAGEHLHAAALAVAVAPVAGAALSFLMRHGCSAPRFDLGHAHGGELLAVALVAAVVLAPLLLEDQDLLRLALLHDLRR